MKAFAVVVFNLLLVSCTSVRVDHPWARPDSLREMFPLGETSASEVYFRWRPKIPALSFDRGAIDRHWDTRIRNRVAAAEAIAGRAISKCDMFVVSTKVQCWFYYDDRDRLIYAETEHWKQPKPSTREPSKQSVVYEFPGPPTGIEESAAVALKKCLYTTRVSLVNGQLGTDGIHDYALFFAGWEIDTGFEGVYYQDIVFVKKKSDEEWSDSRVFIAPDSISRPFNGPLHLLESTGSELKKKEPNSEGSTSHHRQRPGVPLQVVSEFNR